MTFNNLAALLTGAKLTSYQMALAQQEFDKLNKENRVMKKELDVAKEQVAMLKNSEEFYQSELAQCIEITRKKNEELLELKKNSIFE